MSANPIILTLQFDEASSAFFDAQRRAHYPPAINRTPAHLTLFHALPGEEPDAILRALAPHVRQPAFPVLVERLIPLGRGVAYGVASQRLLGLRRALAETWREALTRQDRERFRPHVTIQNKVTPQEARATLARLEASFAPFRATAEGVQLWWYRGGPWQPLAAVPFAG